MWFDHGIRHTTGGLSLHMCGGVITFGLWPYWSTTEPGEGARKGGQHMAHGHMAFPYDREKGERMESRACAHNLFVKWFFTQCFGFLVVFSLFLVDSLHFWGILSIFGGQILGGSWS
jgi:hypothetical protein